MLIGFKVKTELPIIMLVLRPFEWFKQISDIVHGEQRTAQDSHDFNNGTTNLHVMFNGANETVCDDDNMYLNTDCILGFTPKGLDAEMLLDPLEEQLNLPPVFIKECNTSGAIIYYSIIGDISYVLEARSHSLLLMDVFYWHFRTLPSHIVYSVSTCYHHSHPSYHQSHHLLLLECFSDKRHTTNDYTLMGGEESNK